MNGSRFWMMQHMVKYSKDKENENDVARVFFAAGVFEQCKWAPREVLSNKISLTGRYAVNEIKMSQGRLNELQKNNVSAGKESAIKYGCDYLLVGKIRDDYQKYFTKK